MERDGEKCQEMLQVLGRLRAKAWVPQVGIGHGWDRANRPRAKQAGRTGPGSKGASAATEL